MSPMNYKEKIRGVGEKMSPADQCQRFSYRIGVV